jgi:hypothetical protein
MTDRPSIVRFTTIFLSTLVLSAVALAQLVDTKDASNISLRPTTAPQEPLAGSATNEAQEKDCFIDHYHGAVVRRHPEKLHLEIVSAESHFVDDATEIEVTVRLKNEGRWAVLVPWQTDTVEPARTGGPNDEVSYEGAILRLTLGTQENRARGAPLEGNVEFNAVPNSYEQHVKLLHGQWVEVKFKALAKCLYNAASPPLCSEFKADEHAQLAAHWSEWLFTRQGAECQGMSRSAKARKIDSDAIEF